MNGASIVSQSFGEGFAGGQVPPNSHVSQSQTGSNKVGSWSQHVVQILQCFLELLIDENEGEKVVRRYKHINRVIVENVASADEH